MNLSADGRVLRPLGMTLAILSAMIVFGGFPLIEFYLAWRLNAGTEPEFRVGGFPYDFLTQLMGIMALLVIITSFLAWLGRPHYVRLAFLTTIVVSLGMTLFRTLYRALVPETETLFGVGQSSLVSPLCSLLLVLQVLTALYIIWYANRAPARAFYTQIPLLSLEEKAQQDGKKGT